VPAVVEAQQVVNLELLDLDLVEMDHHQYSHQLLQQVVVVVLRATLIQDVLVDLEVVVLVDSHRLEDLEFLDKEMLVEPQPELEALQVYILVQEVVVLEALEVKAVMLIME
jgi:hypothetical protein